MISLTKKPWLLPILALAIGSGCDGGEGAPDGGGGDAGPLIGVAPTCAAYCTGMIANCADENEIYASMAECMTVCTTADWDTGGDVTESGPTGGNTLGCRQYHGVVAAPDDPALHCPHASDDGAGVCGSLCESYCELVQSGCTGANEVYANGEECMAACANFDDSGTFGATMGDTVQCRLYHVGVAIRMSMPDVHCPHTAPDGGGVCVGGWEFSTVDPAQYTRVDRMGMPAVATALVGAAMKNAYNDADPADDVAGTFAGELIANLTTLHGALDDELTAECSMADPPMPADNLPGCLAQEISPGVSVASLVLPDDLTLNLGAAAGFPNGRGLTEPVIDVTLAILLLDVDVTDPVTGAVRVPPANPGTLAGVPLNPNANDVALPTEFPYFAPAQDP